MCYFNLAIEYFNQRDTVGFFPLADTVAAMHRRYPENIYIEYDYHSLAAAVNTCRFELTEDTIVRNRMMQHSKQAVTAMEQLPVEEWRKSRLLAYGTTTT